MLLIVCLFGTKSKVVFDDIRALDEYKTNTVKS